MMSTTARYSIKPKTLTLLELSQSMNDFRQPPPSVTSYQYQSSSNTAQILTRRLYLHPLTINANGKQQLSKPSTISVTSPENEQGYHSNSDRHRETHHSKTSSSNRGLAVLSSSFPLTARTNPKAYTRPFRDKFSVHTDDDTNSDYDFSSEIVAFNRPNLSSITRGTFASTRTKCTRPACVKNRRKTYAKPTHLQKINAWQHLDRTLHRPIPLDPPTTPFQPRRTTPSDPPTTPLSNDSNFNIENHESQYHYFNSNSIQGIQIYKRNPREKSFINDDHDYDDYIYNKE